MSSHIAIKQWTWTYTLANVTIASNNGDLSGKHDIGGTLNTIDQGFTAAVVVVELGLGDRVVDVDGRDLELAITESLVEVVDTSGGFLRDTANAYFIGSMMVYKKR
jgi:hypothetical protein